jgi:hypothetical protein
MRIDPLTLHPNCSRPAERKQVPKKIFVGCRKYLVNIEYRTKNYLTMPRHDAAGAGRATKEVF